MYISEDKILQEAKALVAENSDGQVSMENYQKLMGEYETLLSEIKFITKISDRLQNKLNSINENLLEQTVQLESAQKLIMIQNDELKQTKSNLENTVAERTEELQVANHDLKATNIELDTFVYRASHDIKGPIMSMLGICNLADMESINDVSKEYFGMLSEVAKQLHNKLNRLLTINNLKKKAPSFDTFQLQEIFDSTISSLAQFKGHDYIDISVDYPQDIQINSDLEVMQILFDNLSEYAIKNMGIREGERLYLKIEVKLNDGLQGVISFNGNKIPENIRDQIFKMFYRTNNNPDLTGMELYTSSLAAERLNGTVKLLSSSREETAFSLHLPNVTIDKQ
ncbi:MAG: signal transduction histidine kinase [Flammeovirgaceae bacterium]|jgi:signal transduction histidine kinase